MHVSVFVCRWRLGEREEVTTEGERGREREQKEERESLRRVGEGERRE